MSSLAKRMTKSVTKNNLMFPSDMYNNTLGSLVIANWILTDPESQPNINFIKTQWRKIKKTGLGIWLDNPNFIVEALKIFKLKPHYGNFCMCQSSFNLLFAPYVNKQVYPLREDGVMSPTLRHGKIYPICEELTNDDNVERTEEKN